MGVGERPEKPRQAYMDPLLVDHITADGKDGVELFSEICVFRF